MVPSIYGENMFDDFFDNSFFGGQSPLFGKHERNLMKTDIHETGDAKACASRWSCPASRRMRSMWM